MQSGKVKNRLESMFKGSLNLRDIFKLNLQKSHSIPGTSPGIEGIPDIKQPPASGSIRIRCIDYDENRVEDKQYQNIEDFLISEKPEWGKTRWLNIDGLNSYVVQQLSEHFLIHTLAAEDILNLPQRPKIETYNNHFFIIVRMFMLAGDKLTNEQVSIIYFKDTLITIQEKPGDVWDLVRTRINNQKSRFHKFNTSYLLYALLDAIIDHCFPLLEQYSEYLANIEERIIENADKVAQKRIHQIKRELLLLRRVIWPMREVIDTLYRDEEKIITKNVKPYIRDVYDHTIQIIDIIESYREMANSLHDLYMSTVANHMNDVMKVLTIIASFFIPITFLAGIYGMNFEYIPELKWKYSYAVFWIACLLIVGTLACYFWKKGWLDTNK